MEANDSGELPSSNVERAIPETGPYVLRILLEDLPLSVGGDRDDIEITCVEFLGTRFGISILALFGLSRVNRAFVPLSTANPAQIRTSTLELPPPRFFISYKYLPITQICQENRHTF
jgi:hypothetical protein